MADMVPILQIEALGRTAEEIVAEAKRQEKLGLDRSKTVYKIPISLEGARACKMLRSEGFLVNLHLVYTLQQAYMAMAAGATYVCPLVGRLQDQGTDALQLVASIVDMKLQHGYDTKIMFSSVRHLEHVRNAIELGVDTITVPWKVMKQMTNNHLTELGSEQFFVDNRRVTTKVAQAMRAADVQVAPSATIQEALVKMTKSGYGAVVITDQGQLQGIFTDGDVRRWLETQSEPNLQTPISAAASSSMPSTIDADALLNEAAQAFSAQKVDQLVVLQNGQVLGLLDIQDLVG
ncbi:MAG: CBS domain-containing protein [Flavobacteriia bacterium]|nr:CBS domain-containing protein [Flavobacteriia bacterium]